MNAGQLYKVLGGFLNANPKLAHLPVKVNPRFGTNLYGPQELMAIELYQPSSVDIAIHLDIKQSYVPPLPPPPTSFNHPH